MWTPFTKKIGNREELHLEKILFGNKKPFLSKSAKLSMKSHILSNIKSGELLTQSADNLSKKLIKASSSIKLSSYLKSLIKERVMSEIENRNSFSWVYQYKFAFKRFAAVGLMIAIVMTGVFSFTTSKNDIVFANPSTSLTDVSGDVSIIRNEKEIRAENDFILYQSDVIETRNGTATVKYFDGSISRLSKNTKVKFSKLDTDYFGVNTSVEMDFDYGQMWSMVFDLLGNSLFKVRANKATASVVDRATFSLLVDKNKAEVDVFNNIVDVSGSNGLDTKPVLKGYRAVVNSNVVSLVTKKYVKSDEKTWVENNLKKDKEYIARALNDQSSVKQVASGSGTSLKEDASLYLTFNDSEKLRLKLNIADDKIAEADSLMSDGRIDEGRESLSYLKQTVDDAKRRIDEIKTSDPEEAAKMESIMNEKLLKYKKLFSLTTPDVPSYEVKETIADMQMSFAQDETEKVRLMLEKASSKILEAQDLIVNKKYDDAKSNLIQSQAVIADIQKMDLSKNPDLLKEVLSKNADIVKMLTLIENSSTSLDLKEEVNRAKNSTVRTMIDAAEQANDLESVQNVDNFVRIYNQLGPVDSGIEESDSDSSEVSPKIKLFYDSNSLNNVPADESNN